VPFSGLRRHGYGFEPGGGPPPRPKL
jgi:hypothetical protein